jgi:hypothetical protein
MYGIKLRFYLQGEFTLVMKWSHLMQQCCVSYGYLIGHLKNVVNLKVAAYFDAMSARYLILSLFMARISFKDSFSCP